MFIILVLIVLAAWPAQAGAVYKCTVAGKVSYGDQPCASGGIELAPPPAPARAADGAAELQRQKAALAGLEKRRHASEAAQERIDARLAKAAAATARRCAKLGLQQQWLQEDLARSQGKARDAMQRKAQRHRQAMRLECR